MPTKQERLDDLINFYQDYLITQYRNKPKALAWVELMTKQLTQDLVGQDIIEGYDIDTAQLYALKILAKIVGLSLVVGDPTDPEIIRQLLKLKIATNSCNHDVISITNVLQEAFPNKIWIVDEFNMSFSYYVDQTIYDMFILAYQKKIIPKPVGVKINIFKVDYNKKYFAFAGSSLYPLHGGSFAGSTIGEGFFI